MLSAKPAAKARKEVLALASDEDRLAFGDRELHWLPSGGILDSALDFKSIGRLLGPMTTRTKGTIEQVAAKYFPGRDEIGRWLTPAQALGPGATRARSLPRSAVDLVTGLVDSVSYLALGHVFVANMTGNVVLLGFALAGAPGLSAPASLAALARSCSARSLGGLVATYLRCAPRPAPARGDAACAALLLSIAFVLARSPWPARVRTARYALLVPMGLAMGSAERRRAAARGARSHDDGPDAHIDRDRGRLAPGGRPGRAPRPAIMAIAAIFLGALVGALFVVHVDLFIPLALATFLMASTALIAHVRSSEDPGWTRPTRILSGVQLPEPEREVRRKPERWML